MLNYKESISQFKSKFYKDIKHLYLKIKARLQGKVYIFHEIHGEHMGLVIDMTKFKYYKPGKTDFEIIVGEDAVLKPPYPKREAYQKALNVIGGIKGDNVSIINNGIIYSEAPRRIYG